MSLFDIYKAKRMGLISSGSLFALSVGKKAKEYAEFNKWDEEWELANINWSTYLFTASTSGGRFVSKNYIPVKPNTAYYITPPTNLIVVGYETDNPTKGAIVYYGTGNGIFNIPENCNYIKFGYTTEAYGTSYKNNICLNVSKTEGSPKNGDYVPYKG